MESNLDDEGLQQGGHDGRIVEERRLQGTSSQSIAETPEYELTVTLMVGQIRSLQGTDVCLLSSGRERRVGGLD